MSNDPRFFKRNDFVKFSWFQLVLQVILYGGMRSSPSPPLPPLKLLKVKQSSFVLLPNYHTLETREVWYTGTVRSDVTWFLNEVPTVKCSVHHLDHN